MIYLKPYLTVSLISMLAFSLFVMSNNVPLSYATGSGKTNFFSVSNGACTSTVWPTFTTDGNVGFPSNLPGGSNPQVVPTVSTGTVYMCLELILTSQNPKTTYTIQVQGSTITSNSETCKTDSSGNAKCYMVFTLTVLPGCETNPIKISPKVEGAGDGGTQIHHITNLNYPSCTVSVPEFPTINSTGFISMIAIMASFLILMRTFRVSFTRMRSR